MSDAGRRENPVGGRHRLKELRLACLIVASAAAILRASSSFNLWGHNSNWEPPPVPRKKGYKSPAAIVSPEAVRHLRNYWPSAKLLVGVRHPVLWFESYYNFKRRKTPAETMAIPESAYYHVHLSYLGKTMSSTNPEEQHLLATRSRLWDGETTTGVNTTDAVASTQRDPAGTNPVLLYELSQLSDPTDSREERYRSDLQKFLGRTEPFVTWGVPKTKHHTEGMNICDTYRDLRLRLLHVGKDAAEWIATASDPKHFRELLGSWSVDPCHGRRGANATSATTKGHGQ